jgi:hypothetical protein
VQAAMGAAVVIADVLAKDALGVALAEEQDVIEAVATERPNQALVAARGGTSPQDRGAARGSTHRRCYRGRAADSVAGCRRRPRSCAERPTRPSGAR